MDDARGNELGRALAIGSDHACMMQVRDSMPGQNTRVSMFHQPMLWCHPVAPLLLLLVEYTPVEAQCWHVKLWGGSNTIVNNEVTGHKYCYMMYQHPGHETMESGELYLR